MSAFAEAKRALEAGRAEEACAAVRRVLWADPPYTEQAAAARLLERLEAAEPGLQPLKVAVLGSTTTAQLIGLLRLHGFKNGLKLEVYEAPFGLYRQEVLDPGSALYRFAPQAVLLFVNHRDAEPGAVEEEAARWEGLWRTLRARARCSVVMNNFDLPVERPLGNLEGAGRLRRLNALLAERAGEGVLILDQEHLSAVVGKERWHDARFWHHSRQAMSFAGLTRYAAEAAALLAALSGRSRKALVVDLDNTLWGGIVGEDGVDGLSLDGGFLEFQAYLKALKDRGVLLAAASKNDPDSAREPFLKRKDMLLKLEDFADFRAGWEEKPAVLRAIAATLNIGLDAVAFADDNPVEREEMRRFNPQVAVVELPQDPADYVRVLDAMRLFEPAALSAEDAARTEHFRAERDREALRASADDLPSFLKGLGMRAELGPFRAEDVPRIAQLVNKTNQFNLLARRTTEAETRALAGDPAAVTLAARLSDRYGDYGLVAVLAAREEAGVLSVENWLMSCRVLGRGLEKLMFNRLLEEARRRGARAVVGRYEPTPKNGLVKDLYRDLGFAPDPDGSWRLDIAAAAPKEVFIADGSVSPAR